MVKFIRGGRLRNRSGCRYIHICVHRRNKRMETSKTVEFGTTTSCVVYECSSIRIAGKSGQGGDRRRLGISIGGDRLCLVRGGEWIAAFGAEIKRVRSENRFILYASKYLKNAKNKWKIKFYENAI